MSAAKAKKKRPKAQFMLINEHFEEVFNAVFARVIVMLGSLIKHP